MKLISWNCNMTFRKKYDVIFQLKPDVLIVQESEQFTIEQLNKMKIEPSDYYWYGKNNNKGVSIFTFNHYKIDSTKIVHNELFEFIIPLQITNTQKELDLYAVWTQKTYDGHYTRQIFRAVEFYKSILSHSANSIIVGDFNSNSIWDKPNRETNHTNLVSMLNDIGMKSIYHTCRNEEHGAESSPTLFFQRNMNKQYHIDYCFVSQELLRNSTECIIGQYEDYISFSDHMPIIIEIVD